MNALLDYLIYGVCFLVGTVFGIALSALVDRLEARKAVPVKSGLTIDEWTEHIRKIAREEILKSKQRPKPKE